MRFDIPIPLILLTMLLGYLVYGYEGILFMLALLILLSITLIPSIIPFIGAYFTYIINLRIIELLLETTGLELTWIVSLFFWMFIILGIINTIVVTGMLIVIIFLILTDR